MRWQMTGSRRRTRAACAVAPGCRRNGPRADRRGRKDGRAFAKRGLQPVAMLSPRWALKRRERRAPEPAFGRAEPGTTWHPSLPPAAKAEETRGQGTARGRVLRRIASPCGENIQNPRRLTKRKSRRLLRSRRGLSQVDRLVDFDVHERDGATGRNPAPVPRQLRAKGLVYLTDGADSR